MLTKDVIDHYGSRAAVATALGISRVAVGKWGDTVPEGSAYKLQVISKNKLRVDPALYGNTPNNTSDAAA
jgi:transcriptional repressor of cell division inhibition gene dicB